MLKQVMNSVVLCNR